ncbi:hypothetical protein HOLleu_09506 [Holothuria leucospilota]|uniref:Uncharacterized protein n=1 Tax=Holothuria leucospilota TaxID=206669 RepID=A0A9Q1CD04_HOLLE|nr:hypothetical protein HOLleu_09506 [Holothuria leucospilota]
MGCRKYVDFDTYPQSNSKLDAVLARGEYHKVKPAPPISGSDHTIVHVLPVLTEKHRESQPKKKKLKPDPSKDNTDILRDALVTTDWNVFRNPRLNIDELTEVASCYINFVSDLHVPKKATPLVTLSKRIPADVDIKRLEKEKRHAIEVKDRELRNRIQRDINRRVYQKRTSVFQEVVTADSKSLWDLLRTLRSPDNDEKQPVSKEMANELKVYFGRFNDSIC